MKVKTTADTWDKLIMPLQFRKYKGQGACFRGDFGPFLNEGDSYTLSIIIAENRQLEVKALCKSANKQKPRLTIIGITTNLVDDQYYLVKIEKSRSEQNE